MFAPPAPRYELQARYLITIEILERAHTIARECDDREIMKEHIAVALDELLTNRNYNPEARKMLVEAVLDGDVLSHDLEEEFLSEWEKAF